MFRNPVGGNRIVPFGEPRTSHDVLKNGHPAFRVTQRFHDWDVFFKNRIHGGMDLGNFWCHEGVFAMAAGRVSHRGKIGDALVVILEHPNGYSTEYWHLYKINKTVQVGALLKSGHRMGQHGSTGLNVGGCHLHVTVRNALGVAVDPWPLLNQNR